MNFVALSPGQRAGGGEVRPPMAPSILVLSASVGAGHVRAAEALEEALRRLVPDAAVKNVDVMDLTNIAFRRLYARAYMDLVNRAPHVLGYFYDWLDQPTATGSSSRADRLRLVVEKLNLRRFIRLLEAKPWDLVVNTHFLPAEIIAALRRQERLRVPQVTVTTDYETHRLWVNQPCEHYFTATEEGALYLQHLGVPAADTTVTGIPIHPAFSEAKDRAAVLKKHGLSGDKPVVLHLAGGFGVGPMEKLFRALLDVTVPLELVTVTGRNEQAKAQLQAVKVPPRHRARVLGFTREIDELMSVAELVVSKPGGLTTAEALASGAAMVIVNPVPGQESRNSDFLLENRAAIKANQSATLAYKVTQLLRQPERLAELKANACRLGRPRAAFAVAERALKLVRRARGGSRSA